MSTINKETMSLFVECEDCKTKFSISASAVTHKKEFNVNGQSIFLTYYDCPKCGRRHYVQIDDEKSIMMLNNALIQFKNLSIIKNKGKEIKKNQSAKFKKTRQDLSNYRINLMKEYTGKLVHDNETDFDFVLRFSV